MINDLEFLREVVILHYVGIFSNKCWQLFDKEASKLPEGLKQLHSRYANCNVYFDKGTVDSSISLCGQELPSEEAEFHTRFLRDEQFYFRLERSNSNFWMTLEANENKWFTVNSTVEPATYCKPEDSFIALTVASTLSTGVTMIVPQLLFDDAVSNFRSKYFADSLDLQIQAIKPNSFVTTSVLRAGNLMIRIDCNVQCIEKIEVSFECPIVEIQNTITQLRQSSEKFENSTLLNLISELGDGTVKIAQRYTYNVNQFE